MRTGENIYKRKDRRWEARVSVGRNRKGHLKYKSLYAPTYREVKKKKLLFEENQRKEVKIDNYEPSLTFKEAAEQWLKSKETQWKPATFHKYENCLRKYLYPQWADFPITKITQKLYNERYKEVAETGHSSASSLVNLILRSIQKDLAVRENVVLSFLPTQDQKTSTHCRKTKNLSDTEWNVLSQYAAKTDDNTALGILICLYEGIRIGELCALRWKDVDCKMHTLHIRETVQRLPNQDAVPGQPKSHLVFGPPKNGKERHIPIHPVLTARFRKEQKQHHPEDFILSGTDKVVEPRTFTNRFHRVLSDCGIRKVNAHLLRHSFASRCVEAGMDIKALSEILGHTSVKITMDRYVHLSHQYKQKQLGLLNFPAASSGQKKRQAG